MPCFMAHQPAGIQIYLATSFVFTMLQSAALRNDSFRSLVGLTPKDVKPPAPKTATEFMNLKKFEQEAKEERGEGGEVLGADGVLAPGWEASKVGRVQESTIAGSGGGDRLGNVMRSRASGDPARLRELWSPALRVPEEGKAGVWRAQKDSTLEAIAARNGLLDEERRFLATAPIVVARSYNGRRIPVRLSSKRAGRRPLPPGALPRPYKRRGKEEREVEEAQRKAAAAEEARKLAAIREAYAREQAAAALTHALDTHFGR